MPGPNVGSANWGPSLNAAIAAIETDVSQVKASRPVSGSRGGNAALANLLTALAQAGIIVDNTTA